MSNLREKYNKELRVALKEELGLNNIMAVPKVTKVVINMGVGEAVADSAPMVRPWNPFSATKILCFV